MKLLPILAVLVFADPVTAGEPAPPPNVAAPPPGPRGISPELEARTLPKDGRFIRTPTLGTPIIAYALVPEAGSAGPPEAWMIGVYRAPTNLPAGRIAYLAMLYRLDCQGETATPQMTIFFDAAGAERTRQPGLPPQPVRRGTSLASAFNMACKGQKPTGPILQGVDAVLTDAKAAGAWK